MNKKYIICKASINLYDKNLSFLPRNYFSTFSIEKFDTEKDAEVRLKYIFESNKNSGYYTIIPIYDDF